MAGMTAKLTKAQRSEASDVAEQMFIEPEQFAFELVYLRSQLSACQREMDEARKLGARNRQMAVFHEGVAESAKKRLEAAEQQLKALGNIQILSCSDCGKLVISVGGTRKPTYGANCHGASKCSGKWHIVAEVKPPAARALLEKGE